ncbi:MULTISPECIES: glycoside hydrolase family 88 protein [Caulobacter]|jgi:rhamnogalacturonyl hydrolase YesR|uniref:Putative unsaturated glucuronyl hydrolase n=1 Tax=Caulobacter vibrioides OR37 TaxID=1292034 RepID=R0ELQ6_CAUVI|nr:MULTISPECIES: glycoside hydrolase family 88 protein [Caulobacter]ENZ82032.1 putative unsaturated glucuronyl hydrolase [Caulobacter vibrioides OR37]MBQ1560953.1 glycoside hydrolase family 88 protein [Caulobacter sp.]
MFGVFFTPRGLIAVALAGTALASGATAAATPARAPHSVTGKTVSTKQEALPSREAVLTVLNRANSAQMKAMRAEPIPLTTGGAVREISSNWVSATYYVGAARLARVTQDKETLKFLTDAAEHYNYALRGAKSGKAMLNADEMAIGDLYEELYARRRQEGVIMPLRQRLDWALPHLTRQPIPEHLVWWWSDALFMAPPVLARMSALTGDAKYLKAMDTQWWRTFARLYDPDESLYYRDERFIERRDEQGRKLFWSRGNGWVMGGMARVLEAMPADYIQRPRYIAIFQAMAKRIAGLQRADGLWPSSLLQPDRFPEAETSGSAFFVYALAWGINHGVLDRATYLPTVVKGWKGLEAQVLPNGMLGAVQKTGDQPVATAPDDIGPYGAGAFLLAGLEVMNLGEPATALPLAEPSPDAAAFVAATSPTPAAPRTVRGPEEEARHATEMKAVAALAYDPAIEGPGLAPARVPPAAPGQPTPPKMIYRMAPPPVGQDKPRATVRYAPERYDDILWENDRTAHRIYGPALEQYEPPSSSGIDAWGKSVRYPFMTRQLRTGDQHAYHGEGVDYYNVKTWRGAGGLGVWDGGRLWVSRNWKDYKILKDGPDVASFRVSYAPWKVGQKRQVWETRTFALPLGTNFTRMVSTFGSNAKAPITVAIGITKAPTAKTAGDLRADKARGVFSFWDVTDPDKGAMGVALLVDPRQIVDLVETESDWLVLVKVTPGKPFVYYMGAAWDKGLDFHSRADWETYVFAQKPDFNPAR